MDYKARIIGDMRAQKNAPVKKLTLTNIFKDLYVCTPLHGGHPHPMGQKIREPSIKVTSSGHNIIHFLGPLLQQIILTHTQT